MTNQYDFILPENLSGPRSYFTDLDATDSSENIVNIKRNLKLQLLTKKTIIMGASNMYHDKSFNLFLSSIGLTKALNEGIILPAIRDDFQNPIDFFDKKKGFTSDSRSYFIENTSCFVPWALSDNSSWFKDNIYAAMYDSNSPLRVSSSLSDVEAKEIIDIIESSISEEKENQQYLSRAIINKAIVNYNPLIINSINDYSNLIYRISGARTVNSEGHFPQCNLISGEISNVNRILSDSTIFWDIFVETILQNITSAARVSPSRLDRLTFKEILEIRSNHFESSFSALYDDLLEKAKKSIVGEDPKHIILRAEQLCKIAEKLRALVNERLKNELDIQSRIIHENSLWQIANVINLISNPIIGSVVGVLSALKSIPEITAPISNKLTKSLDSRSNILRNLINKKIGWNKSDKTVFLDFYKSLLTYGI